MSLDVYLKSDKPVPVKGTGIFVRKEGKTYELSYEEACEKYPDYVIIEEEYEVDYYYTDNITHNLNRMAEEVGIYNYLWRPEEIDIFKAYQLIDPLREGLHKLKMYPDKFKTYNPENGWGTYEQFVKFVSNYLDACYEYPNATIEVSR